MTSRAEDALHYPATARNRDAILAVLKTRLPAAGTVAEIASGSGEHIAYFAGALPALSFQPTDIDPAGRRSIAAHTVGTGRTNVLPPLDIDVARGGWQEALAGAELTAVLCINMIHISPWSATEGLLRGTGDLLGPGGVLYLYGPFHVGGAPTAASNAAFDESLRARNPDWGVRHLEDVTDLAASHGLAHRATIEMPANNLSVIFEKT